jgi:hypothetical protein
METINTSANSQRLRLGVPLGILLAVGSAPLLTRMGEVVRDFDGLRLLGTFTDGAEVVDWLVWNRPNWHFAFVDLALPGAEDLVRRLVAQPRAGLVVAVVDHLWREVREKCTALGASDLVEKGDVIAFRSYLESRLL